MKLHEQLYERGYAYSYAKMYQVRYMIVAFLGAVILAGIGEFPVALVVFFGVAAFSLLMNSVFFVRKLSSEVISSSKHGPPILTRIVAIAACTLMIDWALFERFSYPSMSSSISWVVISAAVPALIVMIFFAHRCAELDQIATRHAGNR